jgi:hypothetical protein
LDLSRAHAGEISHQIGIPACLEHDGVHRRLGIPSLTPLPHGLDLLGLIKPDLLAESAHTRHADVKHELTHAQGTGVVLHHCVNPAQVVGAAGRAHIMGVGVGTVILRG